jgi:integral membrane protein
MRYTGDVNIELSRSIKLTRWFRWVALFEGVSFLVLLGIAMPLKYIAGYPLAVRVVGSAHGVLFVAYVLLVAALFLVQRWSLPRVAQALVLSVVPFGTFALDRRLRAESVASARV